MIELELSKREALILLKTLESEISDLRMEIADTDLLEYREMLEEKKDTLMRILEGLRARV